MVVERGERKGAGESEVVGESEGVRESEGVSESESVGGWGKRGEGGRPAPSAALGGLGLLRFGGRDVGVRVWSKSIQGFLAHKKLPPPPRTFVGP